MKRGVLSLIIALALCLNLCPVWVLATETADGSARDTRASIPDYTLNTEEKFDATYVVSEPLIINANSTWYALNSSAIQVAAGGKLYLKGLVTAKKGAGVEVLAGGFLSVTGSDTHIKGDMYALDIASGAEVSLSAGTYFGKYAAIRTEGDFADLLAPGCAYFDADGNQIQPEDVADAQTIVVGPRQYWPELEWNTAGKPDPIQVNYDGGPVEAGELPPVIINVEATGVNLREHLRYSYKKAGDSAYTDGLPTNAGTYDIVVSLPDIQNFHAAVSEPIRLVINKINPLDTAPAAAQLVFNRAAQELVTAGGLIPLAVRDGIEIQFATDENGPYSSTIPVGVNAGDYHVWYRVVEAVNYNAVGPSKISGVKISPKSIRPVIELSQSSYVYDGAKKEPEIRVKDETVVVEEDQYTVTWEDKNNQTVAELRDVGTYTAIIQSKADVNYVFNTTAKVEIVAAVQGGLSITGRPDHVFYGDVFALGTTGGTGDGTVKWTISGGSGSSIDSDGKVTVKDISSLTVRAEREVPNYGTVSDTYTFTVEPKPVVADVTVTTKSYDGDNSVANADITAVVKAGDLVAPADSFPLSGLTGTYDNANAGASKTVTLNSAGATASDSAGKYAVSYPDTVKADINPRQVAVEVTLSDHDLKTDASGDYYEYDGAEKTPAVTVIGKDAGGYRAALASSDYTVSYSDNKNVGNAAVTVTSAEGGNYSFNSETVHFAIRKAEARLTRSPQAKSLAYTGAPQELVTVGEATGGHMEYALDGGSYSRDIPEAENAGTYIVRYKVVGDGNYADSATVGSTTVVIRPKEITPKLTLDQSSYVYDGYAKMPGVKVEDGSVELAAKEYSVSYYDNVNAGTATVIVSDANGGNYYVINSTATFQIAKAPARLTNIPTEKSGLQYNGAAQELLDRTGLSDNGDVVYSVNGRAYSPAIPTESAVGSYTITYKVLGDANHSDTAPVDLPVVEIAKNNVTSPRISLSADQFQYSGGQQKPTITVYDNSGRLIPEHEYDVTITGTNGNDSMVDVGTYTVKVTAAPNSNYIIQGSKTFKIVPADQEVISITGTKGQVFYGDVIQLGTTGGAGGGSVTWKITGNTDSTLTPAGLLTVKDVGASITVTATRSAGSNYDDISATWEFVAGKKQVTAALTGVDKTYDKTKAAKIKAEVNPSDLAFGDSFVIPDLDGVFDNADVGTNKRITRTGSAPAISAPQAANYDIIYPSAASASILPAAAKVDSEPGTLSLSYDASQAQALLSTPGAATGGTMVYSLDGTNFTAAIPTAKDARTYTVYFKVQGDSNHTDSEVKSIQVEIARQQVVRPKIELTPPSAQHDGNVKRPQVTVWDSTDHVIPDDEYTVVYNSDTDWIKAGSHTVEITGKAGGNYDITSGQEIFTIFPEGQNPLSITGQPSKVQYGDTFTLSAVGGSGDGAIHWSIAGSTVATFEPYGDYVIVTVTGVGPFTVKAYREATDGSYNKSNEATALFQASPKPVTPVVTADDKSYDGKLDATLHASWKSGDLVGEDKIELTVGAGTFKTPDVGASKQVTIQPGTSSGDTGNYIVTWPDSTTASIIRVRAELSAKPQKIPNLVYNGSPQSLVIAGSTKNNIGVIEYSLSRDGEYLPEIPTGTEPGTYTVWYRVADDVNYIGILAEEIEVEIAAAPAGGSTGTTTPDTGSTGTSGASSASTASAPMRTTVRNGTASTVVSAAEGSRLVREAAANQSDSIVIKPEISGDVTKTEVSIPASAVSEMTAKTSAALTVSAPIADVTIPNAALGALSSAGGAVSVATEQVEQSIVLTLTAGGENVESVPGGLTLTVPAENAGPGTVAVLVHDDGTRETIRKSVVEDGQVSIPLSGSATVELVDNSKDFADVPSTSWAADAVAFASAHELFSGTSETTFSPDQDMSRGMLATVLYSLEGRPEQDLTMGDLAGEFSDVSSDAWYAEGVAWAAANGITNGYGDGQFGPNDSITREQFVVMLWKYAGSPEASGRELSFTDADQASGYAREALCWAAENGILGGYSNGQLAPGGTATRAQAAQMLKNFMENT